MAHAFYPSTEISEFMASLIYRRNSRTVRLYRETLSQKYKQKKSTKKGRKEEKRGKEIGTEERGN